LPLSGSRGLDHWLAEKGIDDKADVQNDENERNPLLNVRHRFIDFAVPSLKQLPFIGIKGNRKLFFKLMDNFEFHGIQASIVFHERKPSYTNQDSGNGHKEMPRGGTGGF
jgi:hypothetical protein